MFIEITLKPIGNEKDKKTCYINIDHIVKINERNLNYNDSENIKNKKITVISLSTSEIIETFENKHLIINRINELDYFE